MTLSAWARRSAFAPLLLALTLVSVCALPACGSFGRKSDTLDELGLGALDAQRLAELRGRDPLVAETWLVSMVGAETPEEALEIVDAALAVHPRNENLVLARLQILGDLERDDEFDRSVRRELAMGPSTLMHAVLRSYRIQGLLRSGDPDAALDECFRLGSVAGIDAGLTARGFASVALDFEFLARHDEADEAFDLCLDQGPTGIGYLLELTASRPERAAAAAALLERARTRHPGHVDLHIAWVIEGMRTPDLDAAARRLETMPTPVPFRIQGQVEMLEAQILLLHEEPQEALPLIFDRLDRFVADTHALQTLLACWQQFGIPSDDALRPRLQRARRHLTTEPMLARQIAFVLQQIGSAPAEPPTAEEPAAQESSSADVP